MGRKLEAGWRQFQLLFARQVTRETSSSRAGSRSYIISLGTREEVPPPCNFLMARGGGGEVKTRQAEPGGDGGVRGN